MAHENDGVLGKGAVQIILIFGSPYVLVQCMSGHNVLRCLVMSLFLDLLLDSNDSLENRDSIFVKVMRSNAMI
jgi:hypothetical protein